MEKNELISYAMDAASYLLLKIKDIDRIILYGSVARGDFNEDSDIDLFIDTKNKDAKSKINKVINEYYKTKKFKEWQLKGIENTFSLIIGELDEHEWKDLKRAVLTDGIILYGKFTGEIEKMQQYTLFSFENIKPDKKRVAIFRALYGFKIGKKEYLGLVERIGGARIGKGSILIPISKAQELKKYFNEKKISVRVYDFWSDIDFNYLFRHRNI